MLKQTTKLLIPEESIINKILVLRGKSDVRYTPGRDL